MNAILFNKPYRVLSQFSAPDNAPTHRTLKDFISESGFYPAGRLDFDSEGLMLLTNDGKLQQRISSPSFKLPKTYWVMVEGIVENSAISSLQKGVKLKDGLTRPAKVKTIEQPDLWQRDPPVHERHLTNSSWLSITLSEGKNRQVRRMCANVGHPVLRLVRYSIASWTIDQIPPGVSKPIQVNLPKAR